MASDIVFFMAFLLWLALTASAVSIITIMFMRRRHSCPKNLSRATVSDANVAAIGSEINENVIAFRTAALDEVNAATYTLAFNVARFDYQVFGEHQKVIDSVNASYKQALYDPKYFPRRPAMLPKLLRAINDIESTRHELVRLILQDAVLAGNVLKRANSAFYRQGNQAVESVERALIVLGTEGLRVPVATSVMQPVFHLTRGFFDQFAPITWEQAQCSALAAEELARKQRSADPFVAHLLGLLTGLSRIALFRIVLDKYRNHPNVLPRAEVFIRVMIDHGFDATKMISIEWELSDVFVAAIDEQIDGQVPSKMSPLGRTLYFANLCGEIAVLCRHGRYTEELAATLLEQQGLDAATAAAIWKAATADIDL